MIMTMVGRHVEMSKVTKPCLFRRRVSDCG